MRLTLRTLLAHMDDVLEPNDRAEVGQKIEESEFAKTLLQRIRDVTSRTRLGTPKVLGKGLAADSNTVAEYLDHIMHNEKVQEFEKVCLESDIHLAEVASCHQVLALVLGHPADIDPAMRRRMYDVINRPDEPLEPEHPPVAAAAANGAAPHVPPANPLPVAASPATPVRASSPDPMERERTVPDYLKSESKKSPLLWAIAAGILLLLGLGIARIIGPFDNNHPIAGLFGAKPDPTPVANNTTTAPANNTPAKTTTPENPTNKPAVDPANNQAALTPAVANPAVTTPATDSPVPTTPANPNAVVATPNPVVSPVPGSNPTVNPAPVPATNPAVALNQPNNTIGVEGAAPAVPAGNPANVVAPTVTPATTGPDAVTPVPPQPMPAADPGNVPAAPVVPGIAGRMTQDGTQVLLSWRTPPGGEGAWVRVNANETIAEGERLLGLHTYRPALLLKNGLSLQLIGETQLEVYSTPNEDIPLIRLHFGRIVVASSGKANTKLAIEPGVKQSGLLTLNDPDSLIAIEVQRSLPVGSNPEAVQSQVSANLYIAAGRAQWQPDAAVAAGEPLAGPLLVKLLARPDSLQPPETKLPTWIIKNELSGFDSQASGPFSQLLMSRQSVGLALREFANTDRRAEIKYLAARSLALIDDFDFFIDSFTDVDQKGVWKKEIETLQQALARGPDTAKLVREAFVKQRPAYGEKLYRYLWGATVADLATGLGDDLIASLDSDNLELRVLAYHCLRTASADAEGKSPTHNFVAESSNAVARQQAVQRWKQHVRDLVRKVPAAPVEP